MNFFRRTPYPIATGAERPRYSDSAVVSQALRSSALVESVVGNIASIGVVAVLASGGVLVFMFAAAGVQGNSVVTGAYIAVALAVAGCFGLRSKVALSFHDIFYSCLALSVIASCAPIAGTLNLKETCLLAASLLAYPVGRRLSPLHLEAIKQACFWFCGAIAVAGAVATAIALLALTDGSRPSVFGFDAAATLFSLPLAYFVIAFTYLDRNRSRDAVALALFAFCNFVFAAAMVRFTLIAMTLVVFLAMTTSIRRKDRLLTLLFCVLVLSGSAGLASRPAATAHFLGKALEETLIAPVIALFSGKAAKPAAVAWIEAGNCLANLPGRDSVSVRKALVLDSLSYLSRTGVMGMGLDGYSNTGCIKGYSPHNDFIQAIIEFGWLGGLSFTLLAVWPLASLFRLSSRSQDAAFVFSLCLFLVTLSCVYGRISREISLFLVLGLAVGLLSNDRRSKRVAAIPPVAGDQLAPRRQ